MEAKAKANGVSLDEFLRAVAEGEQIASGESGVDAAQAARDFDAALDELFASDTRRLPGIGLTYSRAEIYADHD